MHSLLVRGASTLLLAGSLAAQMVGVYTVNPLLPAAGTNFQSLGAAVAALAAQGVVGPVWFDVYDDNGPYNESMPFTTSNVTWAPSTAVLVLADWTGVSSTNRVTFRAAPGESPVLDATGRAFGVFWNGADYVTIEGLEIVNAPFDAVIIYSETTHGIATDPIVRRCRIHDCGAAGVTIYGNTPQPANTLVENCFFWHLQTATTSGAGGFGSTARFGYVTTRRTNGTRIVHNTFVVDSGSAGGSLLCAFGANASGGTEVPYAEISNNIVFKTWQGGSIFRIQTPSGSTTPLPIVCDSNCFFDVSAGTFGFWGSGGSTSANTLLDWQLNALRDLASLNADPMFLDLATYDLHLAPGTPCFAASTVAAGVTEDIDTQPRAGVFSIGADEFSGASSISVGAGCAGTAGPAPRLSTRKWPFLGSQDFSLRTDDVPTGRPVLTFASFGMLGVPLPVGGGCNVYLDPTSIGGIPVTVFGGTVGSANVHIPLPANAAFVGTNLVFQQLVPEPTAPLGLVLTNALSVVFAF